MQPGHDNSGHPRGIVVMGVSGSGKSTLATHLAQLLGCPMLEGDAFHSPSSIAKMQSGHALDDADRWPWLDRLGTALGEAAQDAEPPHIAVAACSALKRSYRDRLAAASSVALSFVLLDTGHDEIARRLATRTGHYMPPSLLDSQFATLERPTADENAVLLNAAQTPDALATAVFTWLDVTIPSR